MKICPIGECEVKNYEDCTVYEYCMSDCEFGPYDKNSNECQNCNVSDCDNC